MTPRPLVLGYGNPQRSDDGAGSAVARGVARALPGTDCYAVRQLTPELAEPIAAASRVVFVDAAVGLEEVEVRPLAAARSRLGSHSGSPEALLELARVLYGNSPPAWQIALPAERFEFGDRLSPVTRRAVVAATEHALALCRDRAASS